jgi:perosamine synthetase
MSPSTSAGGPALTYSLFDPSPYGFPDPRVPLLPRLTRRALDRDAASDFALVNAGRSSRVYKRGRYALFDAYRLSGVGATGALLAPAYHCRTMLDPAISLGGELLLYELHADLSPRLDSLSRLLNQAQRPIRAMLLTHYFGFPQQVEPIKSFCDAHGIALIEDCSHALFNLRGHERLGKHGRYTIASPYKLLPCEEGGLLIPGPGAKMPSQANKHPGLRNELSVLLTTLQRKFGNRPPTAPDREITAMDQVLSALSAEDELWAQDKDEDRMVSSSPSQMYLPHEEGLAGSTAARWLMRICNLDEAVRQRRENYRHWCEAVRHLPHCRPLFPVLPDDCAPYMFPLLIDHPRPHFFALKKLGLPIWRWDEMAVSPCEAATHYRQRLLHLPCHQALGASEIEWMHAAVTKVMRQVPITR